MIPRISFWPLLALVLTLGLLPLPRLKRRTAPGTIPGKRWQTSHHRNDRSWTLQLTLHAIPRFRICRPSLIPLRRLIRLRRWATGSWSSPPGRVGRPCLSGRGRRFPPRARFSTLAVPLIFWSITQAWPVWKRNSPSSLAKKSIGRSVSALLPSFRRFATTLDSLSHGQRIYQERRTVPIRTGQAPGSPRRAPPAAGQDTQYGAHA